MLHVLLNVLFSPAGVFAAPPSPPAVEAVKPAESDVPSAEDQAAETEVPTASPSDDEAYELAFLNGEVEPTDPPKSAIAPNRWVSGLKQTGAGLAAGLGLAIIGAAVCSVLHADDEEWGDFICVLGGVAGYAIGTPLGTWAMGEAMGWDGSLLATIGGSVVGAFAFGGLAMLLDHYDLSSAGVGLFIAGVPAAGAAGYQLFSDWNSRSSASLAPKPMTFPLVRFDF